MAQFWEMELELAASEAAATAAFTSCNARTINEDCPTEDFFACTRFMGHALILLGYSSSMVLNRGLK